MNPVSPWYLPDTASCLFHFLFRELGMATGRWGAPQAWQDRRVDCALSVARVLPSAASSQGSCLSLSSFWLSLRVALDLGRVISFSLFWGTHLVSMGLFNTVRSIYCLPWLKPDKIFKRTIFYVDLWSAVDPIKSWYSEPYRNFFQVSFLKVKWNYTRERQTFRNNCGRFY